MLIARVAVPVQPVEEVVSGHARDAYYVAASE